MLSASVDLRLFPGSFSGCETIGLFCVVENTGPKLREVLVISGSAVSGLVLAGGPVIFELGKVLMVANCSPSLAWIELDSDAEEMVPLACSMGVWLLAARLLLDSESTCSGLPVNFAVSWELESRSLTSVFVGVMRRSPLVKVGVFQSYNERYVESKALSKLAEDLSDQIGVDWGC